MIDGLLIRFCCAHLVNMHEFMHFSFVQFLINEQMSLRALN